MLGLSPHHASDDCSNKKFHAAERSSKAVVNGVKQKYLTSCWLVATLNVEVITDESS